MKRMIRLSQLFLFLLVLVGILPNHALAQVSWQDLVVTGGVSVEGYKGNLSAVTISGVDCYENTSGVRECTDKASAAVGEFGLRGGLLFFNKQERSLDLQFDLGLRQFVAGGFEVRDYAPREWVGRTDLSYRETLGSLGNLWVRGGLGARKVEDRPPMPLFIQPGYATVDGEVRFQFYPVRGIHFDARLLGEKADYPAGALTPQLDLLDRQVLGTEVGMSWGENWSLRLHSGFKASEYRNQGTFDPDDPFRRDQTLTLGVTWAIQSPFFAQVGAEGTRNRSNSRRPEYNALSVTSVLSAPLPYDLSLNFFANITDKRYLTRTDFGRLVPGEEADNASVVYLELARPLMVNLDGAIRFGWNRAETDTGNEYFERYGTTLLFRYRPWER